MSTISTIVLKNAANADVTFTRLSGNGLTITLRDAAMSVFAQASKLILRTVMPSAKGNVVRHQQEVVLPVFDANGVKLRESRYIGEYLLPITGTEAERDELIARVKALTAHAVTAENVSDLNAAS